MPANPSGGAPTARTSGPRVPPARDAGADPGACGRTASAPDAAADSAGSPAAATGPDGAFTTAVPTTSGTRTPTVTCPAADVTRTTTAAPGARRTAVPAAATRRWSPAGPLDVRLTVGPLCRGTGDPAFRITPDGAVWRASRTPEGPATLRITGSPAALEGHAWGPGAQWLLDAMPALLGAQDDTSAFTPRHRVVHLAHRRHPGLRLTRTGLVLEALIPAILEQKVTTTEAYRAWRLLLRRHGEHAPGPAPDPMRVMPDARGWARVPSWDWHCAGVDGKRAATVMRAVRVGARLDALAALDPAQAAARLRTIPGIGPWTAAETVQRSHGAADAVTVGDLHLPHHIGYALTGERRSDDETMLRLLAPYAGQRHRATRLILLASPAPPRRAPRLAPNPPTWRS